MEINVDTPLQPKQEGDRLVVIANEIRAKLIERGPEASTDPSPQEIKSLSEYMDIVDERGSDQLTYFIRISKLWNATAMAKLSPEQFNEFLDEVYPTPVTG